MTQADSVHSTPPTNTSANESGKPPLFRRTDISPEDFFQTLGRVRRAARDEIERLIDWLDSTIDCDQDAAVDDEPCDGDTDTEPSLGSFDRMSNQIKAWQTTGFCNAEIDAELDRCDDEPSLGSCDGPGRLMPCGMGGQEYWARGNTDEREGDEHDGAERSLGWSDEEAARGSYPSLMGNRAEHGSSNVETTDQANAQANPATD
jgi:hypothetical protein